MSGTVANVFASWAAILATQFETSNGRRDAKMRANHATGAPVRGLVNLSRRRRERIRQILRGRTPVDASVTLFCSRGDPIS